MSFNKEDKIKALATYLDLNNEDLADIEESNYQDNLFEYGSEEYLVLTDIEADEACSNNILDSLWAFNTSFLMCHIDDDTGTLEKTIEKAQLEMCEDSNELIRRLIPDIDHFINDAILSDGRGHFLSSYDGEENEQEINGEYYLIYRIN